MIVSEKVEKKKKFYKNECFKVFAQPANQADNDGAKEIPVDPPFGKS